MQPLSIILALLSWIPSATGATSTNELHPCFQFRVEFAVHGSQKPSVAKS